MFTYVIKPVLEIIHFIHRSSVFVLTTGYYVGRAIILVFLKICSVVRDIFAALTVIGEELYQFLCELNSSISDVSQYIRTSTNGGVNCLIEAVVIFCRHIRKFFANTRIHSKLLATKLGCFICDFFELIRNALLLIADCCWWLITLVPRFVVYFLIFIGDLIVNAITVVRKSVVYCVTVVVEDIFRLTIAVVLLILLWHNRRRLGLFVLGSFLYLKRFMTLCYRRLVSLILCLFGRRRNPSVVRTTPTRSRLPRPSVSPASGEDKPKDPHQRCVVCRDRQKCVLLLPCKHLCLCEDCADYILFTGQQQKCPLCRTNIVHSMSVYT